MANPVITAKTTSNVAVQLLAAGSPGGAIIYNKSTANLYIRFQNTPADVATAGSADTGWSFPIPQNIMYEVPSEFRGLGISGVLDAVGPGVAQVTAIVRTS